MSNKEELRIRAYNVQFGDAFLISFPDKNETGQTKTRNILIDVGNVLNSSGGGLDDLFKSVMENVLSVLGNEPLDLYVMTHEHLDHVQGLFYAEEKCYTISSDELRQKLKTKYAWLTASAEENYNENHPDAKKKSLMFSEAYNKINTFMRAQKKSGVPIPSQVEALWLNNNPRKTSDCIKYLRNLADQTYYVYREFDPEDHHPFNEAKMKLWAPEEDTSTYYGRYKPVSMSLGVTEAPKGSRKWPTLSNIIPPKGVDAGAFFNLVNMRKGYFENLLTIDKASNNTSVVFVLEWRDLKFLFTGDAEKRSWKTMNDKGVLEPVHFIKVSHHGSHTGTPEPEILKKVLPDADPDGIPDQKTLQYLEDQCEKVINVHELSTSGSYIDIIYDEEGYKNHSSITTITD
jgi:beta-lactamase superfamily II metal-dependent hydrolase